MAEAHLLHVVELQPANVEAHALLAALAARAGRWEMCRLHLALAGSLANELRLRVAETAVMRGERREARGLVVPAVEAYQARLARAPNDLAARLACGRALTLAGEYDSAVAVLLAGTGQPGASVKELHAAVGAVHGARARATWDAVCAWGCGCAF